MFKTIAIAIVVLIAAVLVYATTRPDNFHVERSISVKAPPEKIFPLINDLHAWSTWSPWEKLDPDMKRTFSGPASGKGSGYAWEGNSKVGQGSMLITDTAAPNKVVIKLDFIKPFEGHNNTRFTLQPSGEMTNVIWVMDGPSPYIAKLMSVFVSMDKMVGRDFEIGLANMKAVVEK